jgi:hypothetical protein
MNKNTLKYFQNNVNYIICNVKRVHKDLFLHFISKFYYLLTYLFWIYFE